MTNVVLTLVVGVLGYKIAKFLKIPAPGILGSMLFVGITNIFFGYAKFIRPIKIFSVALSGAYIGVKIKRKDVVNFKYVIKPFFILVFAFTINTFLVGSIIHYFFDLDWMTSLLSCVPGGVSEMSIIAMDLNADAGIVTVMQTVRLIGTLIVFPYWITRLTDDENGNHESISLDDSINKSFLDKIIKSKNQKIIFTMIVAIISGYIGYLSGIPAANMMFPMLVIVFLNINTNACIVTKDEKLVAQIIAGSTVGTTINASIFVSLKNMIIPIIILLVSYFLINIGYSVLCERKKLLDKKSAMFASAPGGATDMTLIGADLGADLTKTALIQSFRAAYVVSVMPNLIVLFVKYFGEIL